MASANVCWGIEVGSGAIKAVKLETDGERVAVRDFAVINHPKVLSTPELDQADALRMALGTLANQHDLSKAILSVSVPGHQSFARFAKLPPIEPKEVPKIVKFEAVQQIPFPLEEVEWDYQTFASPDSPDVEVGIFAVTRARIMEQLSMVGEFGLTPEIATLGPVAAYNALAYDLEFTEDTPGTIILDVGTTATDLIIAEAGRVWVRTFPLGGHQFTDALVTSFKLSYSKAERLKREAEQTKHARHVFQAMRPVFTDLVQEVQRSIGYYQSVHAGADLKRLIGLGNTFRLPGLRKYLKQQLHMDIYRIEGLKRAAAPAGREAEFADASLNLCTAYGLALQGLGSAALQANVMPVPVVRETMWKQKRAWFGIAAGFAAAATAGWFVRPLMDSTAMNAVAPPSDIQRVASTGNKLKTAAEEAGVLDDATGDTTASSLLGLFDGRGIYSHLAADAGEMVGAARAGVAADAERASVRLAALETAYAAPEKRASSDRGRTTRNTRDPRGGSNSLQRGSMPSIASMTQPGSRGQASAEFPSEIVIGEQTVPLSDKRRVNVTATFVTDSEDPEMVAERLVEWLRASSEREGVPYVIAVNADDEMVYSEAQVPEAVATGAALPRAQGRQTQQMRRPMPGGLTRVAPPGRGNTQAGRPPAGSDDEDATRAISEMERVAPIVSPDDRQAAPDAASRAYRVVFTLVLDPVNAGNGGES